jgi:hypothetical protein
LLYNQLLKSDYCRTLASKAISRAVTSYWPGTTLNLLKFPITFLNLKKEKLRSKRLQENNTLFEKIEAERSIMYKKDYDLRHAEYIGIVESSFESHKNKMDSSSDSSYSLDPYNDAIVEGENYKNSDLVENKLIQDARDLYKPSYYENCSAFFYDTPGYLNTHDIIKYLIFLFILL